jgi:hypothetical protein
MWYPRHNSIKPLCAVEKAVGLAMPIQELFDLG